MREFDSEREMMIQQHQQEMTDLQDIMFAMEQNYNERENDAKSEFQSLRDEIKNKVYVLSIQYHQSSAQILILIFIMRSCLT